MVVVDLDEADLPVRRRRKSITRLAGPWDEGEATLLLLCWLWCVSIVWRLLRSSSSVRESAFDCLAAVVPLRPDRDRLAIVVDRGMKPLLLLGSGFCGDERSESRDAVDVDLGRPKRLRR